MENDGLIDAYDKVSMGVFADSVQENIKYQDKNKIALQLNLIKALMLGIK